MGVSISFNVILCIYEFTRKHVLHFLNDFLKVTGAAVRNAITRLINGINQLINGINRLIDNWGPGPGPEAAARRGGGWGGGGPGAPAAPPAID